MAGRSENLDFSFIEKKWQERWSEQKIFEPQPGKGKKFYLTVAYPYPSGAMHIGHIRTYSVPDVIARFKRMQGCNVLFPMAWHVTGTPIIGALNRLKSGEKKQLHVLKDVYRMSDTDLASLNEPMDYANYFINNHYRKGMKALGLSIDWRREFTTNDRHYNRFIEWQYRTLKSKGLVKKGLHPVKWCTRDKNPVTTHDLLEGEDADINEYILVKFRLSGKAGAVLPMATLRPETVYGVTNAWVNPESELAEADVDGEKWIVSSECAEKLSEQNRKVEVRRRFRGSELIGKKAKNPVTGDSVLILPAEFVDPDSATGIVMSVPSHAPFDYIALRDLRDSSRLRKWGIRKRDIEAIKPIHLIDTKDMPENPAVSLIEESNAKSQKDREIIESLTKEIYRKEFHSGVLNKRCGKYAGTKVSKAKPLLVRDFSKKGIFDSMLDFSERVVCRCGGRVIVARKSSWFIDYGNPGWKRKTRNLLSRIKIIPEHMRSEYESTIEWLEDWPCVRNYGLGTDIPWDRKFKIEPLSDSTIYMSYYTISHITKSMSPDSLVPEFFDFVLLGKGDAAEVSRKSGISEAEIIAARKSFEYWYPLDWRLSAHELVQNHLTFFLFHHTALFPKKHHPKGIATWGIGLLEGGKMSSSKGNVILASDAIEKYGADTIRLFLMSSVEPWQDFDWRASEVENYRRRILNFYNRVLSLHGKGKKRETSLADRWLLSRAHSLLRETTQSLEGFQTRKASLSCFFAMEDSLRWYLRRTESPNKGVLNEFLSMWIRMMAPFTPHVCEELWERTGKQGMVSIAEWPRHDDGLIDEKAEKMEELVKKTLEDCNNILKLVGKKPKEVRIFVAEEWKHILYSSILDSGIKDPDEVISHVMKSPEGKKYGKRALRFAQRLASNIAGLGFILPFEDEFSALNDATKFFSRELGCNVRVMRAHESGSEKALRAEPGKPGIEVVA